MADNEQNTSSGQVRSFDKSLNEDVNDFHLPSNQWTQARNATNNSVTGDLGKLGNEPANKECIRLNYSFATIIGFIHIIEDKWLIFSTDGASRSQIGLFKESLCRYDLLVDDSCLGFTLENLIKGVARSTSSCTYKAYWDDGKAPSRNIEFNVSYMDESVLYDPTLDANIYSNQHTTVPYIQTCVVNNGCNYCTNTPALDCDKLRLAQFINPICIRVEKGVSGGNILNGSFMVVMAYAVKGQKISDWYISNAQGLFDHNNSSSSLDVYIDSIDLDYDEVIVGIISTINQQTVVRQAGIYSTRQTNFSFDTIFDTWPTIPIEQIPLMTPIVNKSDAMYNVGDYLLRVGPTSKFDFNYQPLANQIRVKWQSVEYPADYYHKGGNKVGYMRDEVYPFFVQYIYDTGDMTSSYHIPGRPPLAYSPGPLDNSPYFGTNSLPGDSKVFETFNTATITTIFPVPPALGANILPDGGVVLSEGYMGYWESSEIYPDDKPQIWNANIGAPVYSGTVGSDYDLCGKPIRHHKFPEDSLSNETTLFNSTVGNKIRIMGVTFENIKPPVDENGNTIVGIVGYRILRGSRNGNKTVIAKGMINNMGEYTIPGSGGKNGLYPNFPYNDLRPNSYLTTNKTITDPVTGSLQAYNKLSSFKKDHFTFHSPETNFNNPFLATKELRIYGDISGQVEGSFSLSEKHPKEKLVSNIAFLMASIAGVGVAILAANGQKATTFTSPHIPGYSQDGINSLQSSVAVIYTGASIISTNVPGSNNAQPKATDIAGITAGETAVTAGNVSMAATDSTGANAGLAIGGGDVQSVFSTIFDIQNTATSGASAAFRKGTQDVEQQDGYLKRMGPLGAISGLPMFFNYFQDGADSFIRLIRSMLKYRDFAVRYHSHGFYNVFNRNKPIDYRYEVDKQIYLNPDIMDYDTTTNINNLYRSRTVSVKTIGTIPNLIGDNTRFTGGDRGKTSIEDLTEDSYSSTARSYYTGLKVRIKNQYGQLNNINQLPTDSCYNKMNFNSSGQLIDSNNIVIPFTNTGTIFGGDVYINRYTEKNTFFFFYDWLEGQPDGAQFDYTKHQMVPYPVYWANFEQFQTSDFTSSLIGAIGPLIISGTPSLSGLVVPSSYYALESGTGSAGFLSPASYSLGVKGWFYLFNSGVRDFFVESEVNVAYRDYGELPEQKFYDPYSGGSTKSLFETSIIKSGNFYKYDTSLSVTKLFKNYVSWANMQSPQYDPYISATCYVYQDWRIIYSLPAQYEGLKDGWKIFPANDYYDFDNVPTCIKPINKSGAIIFFDAASPVQFQGTDQLETGLGTKLTIGDGGLFSQPLQALVNVESSHEYGSCQNRLSVVNTPAGVFWMSQNQGKIFTIVGGGIKEISNVNMRWWFASYLPYKIIEEFPDFELLDNPVIGVACQSVYDNENGLLYFCKKDYSLKKGLDETLVYVAGNNFNIVDNQGHVIGVIELGNPTSPWDLYFDDASWTVSYDPKGGDYEWLSYHDWHPNFCLPGKNTFLTVNPLDRNSLWIHNLRCDLYCNYYGIDYPFEIEFTVNTGQDINSLRSIQYYLECYKYAPNCYDRFHVLDSNFDEATIYNTEQTSGLLKLILNPKNDPTAILQYPVINPTNINVLFSKEENKYRFNQFWDITDDRGEFFNPAIPGFAQRAIWDTQPNGYVRLLNANNLNYNKADFQRKKFRHYTVSVLLRKLVSGDKKLLVMLADVKNLLSPR